LEKTLTRPLIVIILILNLTGCINQVEYHYSDEGQVKITELRVNNESIDMDNAVLYIPYQNPNEMDDSFDYNLYNISITVENCSDCEFSSFKFKNSIGNHFKTPMNDVDKNHYYSLWFDGIDNEIVWEVYTAYGPFIEQLKRDIKIDYVDILIYFGDIGKSDISTLSISNIAFDLMNYGFLEKVVVVSAEITSNISISNVKMLSFRITVAPSAGSGDGSAFIEVGKSSIKDWQLKGTHQWVSTIGNKQIITKDDSEYYTVEEINYVFYRIIAQDESGNIVVSPSYHFMYA
jgi:hypothetical protein